MISTKVVARARIYGSPSSMPSTKPASQCRFDRRAPCHRIWIGSARRSPNMSPVPTMEAAPGMGRHTAPHKSAPRPSRSLTRGAPRSVTPSASRFATFCVTVRRKRVPSYQDTVPEDEELIELSRLAPVDTRLDVPTTGLYGTHTQQRRYGTAKTVQALKAIGVSWAEKHHSPRIGIGDISKRGGGKISSHVSHRKGVDVDVRPVRNDNQELPVTY